MILSQNKLLSLLRYVQPSKRSIIFASVCSALHKVCDIFPEILIAVAVDVVVRQQNSVVAVYVGIINPEYQLYAVATLTTILWCFESLFEYLYFITWHHLAQTIQHTVRLEAYQKIQNMDLAYFEDKTIGGLQIILQDDVAQLEQFLSQGPNEVIQLMVNVIVIGTLFMMISPTLFLLTLLPIPVVVFIAHRFQHRLSLQYKNMRNVATSMASHVVYRLQGLATIKSYGTQEYELKNLAAESGRYKHAYSQVDQLTAQYIPLVRLAVVVGFLMTMIVGGLKVLAGTIAIYWYAELVFLIQRFLWPFASLTTITDMYQKSQASAKRILNILETHPTIVDGTVTVDLRTCPSSIEFDHVLFEYGSGYQVFNDLTLSIPARTTVAFVGTTGSGKSTLAKLLLRFYDVQRGAIKIDGHDIKDIRLADLRNAIGLVSQDVYIIDGTIAENIAYGTFSVSRDAIIEAAKMAHIHDFIMEFPQGYDTRLEEYGKKLSGGQRQRISIARALLKKACIFIFDEATSALDNETEAEINKSMDQLRHNHTIIIIAHRLSTVRNADTIFVVDHGLVVESGTHDTLLAKNGVYAQLWNMQLN